MVAPCFAASPPGMELDGVEAVRLFKLLDADGNGSIEIDEQLGTPWALRRWICR
jgi:hypothetical protein